jgi:hypothetical protein
MHAANVAQGGIGAFADWGGPLTADTHQMVIDGNSSDTLQLDASESANWVVAGQISHGGQDYDVYNDVGANAQLIVEHTIRLSNGPSSGG